MSKTTPSTQEWKFQQVFGDTKSEEAAEADIISAVEFDPTGNYLAIGDRGGRVVILERNNQKRGAEYKVMTEFQSHEAEFDYLKSLEIEEKINKIKWCSPHTSNSHYLLTTNDKTIKLWKVYEKHQKKISNTNMNGSLINASEVKSLRVPKVTFGDKIMSHVSRKVYANAHAYHINSISLNSDQETFISADDLRINLWHINHIRDSHTVVDIKPANMEDLSEVITSSSFHPSQCHTFMYSSSKGTIKLGDLRQSSTCSSFTKGFDVEEDPSSKTFFSEIIASVSDAKFSPDGRYILSRDYMTLKIWDVKMENKPIKVLNIHEPLRSKLCDLYENDCIFDKFECCFSGDGNNVLTGSYKNHLHIFDRQGRTHSHIEASTSPAIKKKKTVKSLIPGRPKKKDDTFETPDFSKKCLHLAWHPQENIIAVSSVNSLYIFAS
ncbi:protein phosphatase PP2A regulatory subunit B [Acrasis kona]|uniref:Serine/threonine-protein phosphatase 2A 55 kDa regulatory subunit B n=1 Tax=Acrasis kona TaxID=1008807 RepID=A0AAW2Z7G0_9EUKA